MWVENFYVGGQEYVINFKDGTHHLWRIEGQDGCMSEEIYTGHYDKCLQRKQEIIDSYDPF